MHRAKIIAMRARENGFLPGEKLSARCARLDGELAAARADIGARGELIERQPREHPVLDECVPRLFLDALAPLEAAIASAITGVPYTAMRNAIYVDEDHQQELLRAAQAVAAKHRDFLAEHRGALEFIVPLMALNAAKLDHLLTLVDASQAEAGVHIKPCSTREALAVGLIVLAPLVLLALILISSKWRAK